MPYSYGHLNKKIEQIIRGTKAKNFLDIGAGAGKYGKMVKDIFPDAYVTAIEVEPKYIKQFKLKQIYDKVVQADAIDFMDSNPDYICDVAIIGDCIEHLRKSDGVDLIHYLVYRSRYIIVQYPEQMIQYSWQGHSSEAHRSVWSADDFKQFNSKHYKKVVMHSGEKLPMHMVVIKGYIK